MQFKNLMLSIDPADEDSDEEGNKSKVSMIAAGQPAHTAYPPLKVNAATIAGNNQPVVVLNNIDATLNGAAAVPVDLIPKLNSLPNSHHNSTTPNDVMVLDSEESNDASKVSIYLSQMKIPQTKDLIRDIIGCKGLLWLSTF